MAITRFEDIIAWKKAQDVAVELYVHFNNSQDWGFKNQICRAAVSISNNIAEGYNRGSKNEFTRFLNIANASCSEVQSMIYLGERLNYFNSIKANSLKQQCTEISKIINGLLRHLKK